MGDLHRDRQAWYADDEFEGRTTGELEKLNRGLQVLSAPDFSIIQEIVSDTEKAVEASMYAATDTNQLIHYRGQVLGIRVLSNLRVAIENQIITKRNELAEWLKARAALKEKK